MCLGYDLTYVNQRVDSFIIKMQVFVDLSVRFYCETSPSIFASFLNTGAERWCADEYSLRETITVHKSRVMTTYDKQTYFISAVQLYNCKTFSSIPCPQN